jgi:hypothetical protein
MANVKKIIKAVKSAKKAAERAKTDAVQKNSVKVKKNSFDTYSKALGGGTLREIQGRMNKRINNAGLENARSKGPKSSVKVKPAAKPKANPSNPAKTAFKFDSSYKRAANKSIYKKGK